MDQALASACRKGVPLKSPSGPRTRGISLDRNLPRAGNPPAPAVTKLGAAGTPGVKSRRRVIPAGTRSSRRRILPWRPYGRCAGVRRCAPPTPGGPGLVTLTTAPPFEQAAAGKAGPRPNLQALGRPGQHPGTGTGAGSGPPNCGGRRTRRPDPERIGRPGSDWTANYIGRGRKPACGPLPQDGKRWCRGGARREGAGSHITWPDQGTQRLPASRERRSGPRDWAPGRTAP